MSYSRDRDRGSRGVGAIAARDLSPAAKQRRRFGRRARGMGDMPSGDCYVMDNTGAYYIRRANGNIEKVSQAQAMQYPDCAAASSRTGTTTTPAPTGSGFTGPRGASSSPTRYNTVSRTSADIRPTSLYTSGPATSSEPGTVGTNVTPFPGKGVSPTPTPAPTPMPPATSPTAPTKTAPVPVPTSKPTVSTKPTLVTGSSVSSGWVTTPAVSVPPMPAPHPETDDSSSMPSGKTLALVGAGIGLLYLLTRK